MRALTAGVNNYHVRMPSVNVPIPPECEKGHPLGSDPKAVTWFKGKYWKCRECSNAYHRERKREVRARRPVKVKESAPSPARPCLWCGKPIRGGSSEREKWCPTGCFRAWYTDQTGYQLAYQYIK